MLAHCHNARTSNASLEEIDYSICTLEFETRRESYYWLLEALELYRPKVYEFARLNITRTVSEMAAIRKYVCGAGYWSRDGQGMLILYSKNMLWSRWDVFVCTRIGSSEELFQARRRCVFTVISVTGSYFVVFLHDGRLALSSVPCMMRSTGAGAVKTQAVEAGEGGYSSGVG